MSIKDATHKSECGRFLYRVIIHKASCPFDGSEVITKKVGFWDSYCSKWRASLMHEHQLNKL